MERTTARIRVHTLVTELGVLGLVPYQAAGHAHLLATDEDHLLAGEEFLGDYGGEATEEVVAAVDDDGLFEDHGWILD